MVSGKQDIVSGNHTMISSEGTFTTVAFPGVTVNCREKFVIGFLTQPVHGVGPTIYNKTLSDWNPCL